MEANPGLKVVAALIVALLALVAPKQSPIRAEARDQTGGQLASPAKPYIHASHNPRDTPTCNAHAAADSLVSLFDSAGKGASDTATRFFGPETEPTFRWFCMNATSGTGLRSFAAYTVADLRRYLIERATHHERLILTSLDGGSVDMGGVSFQLHATRSADDLPESHYFVSGKGVWLCDEHVFVVLCMGCGLE